MLAHGGDDGAGDVAFEGRPLLVRGGSAGGVDHGVVARDGRADAVYVGGVAVGHGDAGRGLVGLGVVDEGRHLVAGGPGLGHDGTTGLAGGTDDEDAHGGS